MGDSKRIEFEKEGRNRSADEGSLLRAVVDGSLLTRKKVLAQLPFIFFLVFLGLLYISNRYHAETLRNEIESLRQTTDELRSEAIFVSSELMKLSRQTEVAGEVQRKGLDLYESLEPPKKIILEKE